MFLFHTTLKAITTGMWYANLHNRRRAPIVYIQHTHHQVPDIWCTNLCGKMIADEIVFNVNNNVYDPKQQIFYLAESFYFQRQSTLYLVVTTVIRQTLCSRRDGFVVAEILHTHVRKTSVEHQ